MNAVLAWREDCYGYPDQALYLGNIWVGNVYQFGCRDLPTPQTPPWRAWFSSDPDGRLVGWFKTEREAKDALEDEAKRALNP